MANWLLNDTLFTEAVTTTRFECRYAETLAMTSIHASSWPPNKFPSVLVSFGRTTLVVIDKVSDALRAFMTVFFYQRYMRFWKSLMENSF
jgi:hypothetical protein